jgi:hypothetical protein
MMRRSVLVLAAVTFVTLPATHDRADARKHNLCAQTSQAARRACMNEVHDDFWIAIGTCANSADAGERKACRSTAKQARKDGRTDCGEQFDARQELCDALGQAAYAPLVDPSRFLSPAATAANPNPYFPLVPGTAWVYQSGSERITVTVTNETRVILGVTCVVVRDRVEDRGELVEDTEDYFAQDVDATVWYFGELSQTFENGRLADLEGSWTAGVEGARPGTIMRVAPAVGDTYRQEFALGNAEDAAEVRSVTGSAVVPAASCANGCVVVRDFTPLEPGAEDEKYYAPGVGLILEVDVETGERTELVSFTAG